MYLKEDSKCSYYNVIIPVYCTTKFEEEKSQAAEDNELYSDNFELYFIKLDKLKRYRELLITENILKKRAKTFIYELEANLKEENLDESKEENADYLNQPTITDIKLINEPAFLDKFLSNKLHIKEKIEKEANKNYKFGRTVQCTSLFRLDSHVFFRLSALVQNMLSIRFDWQDTIIARDLEWNCFKIQLMNEAGSQSKIKCEIKSISLSELEVSMGKIEEIITQLFSYYPGSHFDFVLDTGLNETK